MRRNTVDVFWSRVDRSAGEAACWPWTGRSKPSRPNFPVGHGVYDHDNTWSYAHRYAFELTNGPTDLWVLHTCDNPRCCNPRHLYAGTALENNRDREARGRRDVRGERGPRAKLTDEAVRTIRAEHGRTLARDLAERFGVSKSRVYSLWAGEGWEHVA